MSDSLFIDKYASLSKQTFDTAVIVDSTGHKVGRIIVRYTDSSNGWNNETGINFDVAGLNLSDTRKRSCNNQDTVYNLFKEAGCKVYGYDKNVRYIDRTIKKGDEKTESSDGVSSCKDFRHVRFKRKLYSIYWV